MSKKKKINRRLGAQAITKKKNLFLKLGGGIDLIERFPTYEKKKRKIKR